MITIDQLSDEEVFLRTIWGEARGEGITGMQAVACVVINRANSETTTWWGTNVRSVCLKRWQFSCWNIGDPNRAKLLALGETDPQYTEARDIAASAIMGELDDVTNGATSYYDKRRATPPGWAEHHTPCAEIGHHLFFKI